MAEVLMWTVYTAAALAALVIVVGFGLALATVVTEARRG